MDAPEPKRDDKPEVSSVGQSRLLRSVLAPLVPCHKPVYGMGGNIACRANCIYQRQTSTVCNSGETSRRLRTPRHSSGPLSSLPRRYGTVPMAFVHVASTVGIGALGLEL